ncbi:unnamed protein product [Schistocephalus solidus]|uniref:Ty3-gypsy retrotransposon protein n=1 Tax=Schistocephalus solidus TaxID=70667 RepID=A0A183TRF8_SCHSO|nr:unnamed protein product [Schistocephalus solidus]
MGLFCHMRIHDSGIHHNADNTDTPCTPSAPIILSTPSTPTTMNDIPSLYRFLLPTLHPQLQLTHRPSRSPANPSHGGWHVFLKSPPAKRAKSLVSFLDVNYEDEAAAISFHLLQKITEIEKDTKRLKMEIEKLKKHPQIYPEHKHSLTGEHKRDKRTYARTASVAITSNKDDGATSTKLGLAVKQSPEREECNQQGPQKMKKRVSEDKGNISSTNTSDQDLILVKELYKASEKKDARIVREFNAPGIEWKTWTAQGMPHNFNHKLL